VGLSLADHCFMLVSCLTYFSTQKMEAICSSETPVDFQQATRRLIPQDKTVYNDYFDIFHKNDFANV
jgi:hypothetical protein